MSRDIRQYWQELRALEAGLPEFVWLATVSGKVVTQVPARVAARLLLRGKSHRLATDEEVAGHQARELEENRAAREERMRRQGASLVVVRPSAD